MGEIENPVAEGRGGFGEGIGRQVRRDRCRSPWPPPPPAQLPPPPKKKTEFDVVLVSVPADKKIEASIKIVRELTGSGPEGSQGPGRRRAQDPEGRREQGRGGQDQEEPRRRRRSHLPGEVVPNPAKPQGSRPMGGSLSFGPGAPGKGRKIFGRNHAGPARRLFFRKISTGFFYKPFVLPGTTLRQASSRLPQVPAGKPCPRQ